ncbi:helix-turn-helix domain-containing protein [Virgibacillus halodenitrificans]|uniref:helix-turn-helix domain-containing protein n=1 Tax=Virgibacillus halodenitrificans TaxID=1482 RepID=UPI001F09F744|nr:helix-turn-helix transcriptional regulator [Virgibacillus halodenitrificans]
MEKKSNVFGIRLKELRRKKGESQEDTAKAIGISRARYSHYENNHVEPDMDLIRKFADYFNVDTDYLMGRRSSPSIHNTDFDSLAELKKTVDDLGIQDIFFHNIDDWKKLDRDDIEDIKQYIEFIQQKAKKRKD